MRRAAILGVVVASGAISIAAAGGRQGQQPPPAKPVLEIQKLRDNLYLIGTGSGVGPNFIGGNTAVFVTERGVVVVDTKLAGWGQAMLDKIKTVSDRPVTMVINTHTHNDHTGSNTEFPATVEFVAHENTRANLSKPTCPPVTNCDAFKGDNAKFLPKRTFKDTLSLMSGKDRIEVYHFGAGHTNGDAFIVFPAVRAMHAGDMFPWKDSPFIDRGNGGSGVALPVTLGKAVAAIKNVDTVIGGHLPPATWNDFQEYQRFNQDVLNASREAKKAGKNVDDAVASMKLTNQYKGYESRRLKAAVAAIYDELDGK
jgi:glyoxylase-like metal-dependent hydrolase (beta-lactamase superfamily II)